MVVWFVSKLFCLWSDSAGGAGLSWHFYPTGEFSAAGPDGESELRLVISNMVAVGIKIGAFGREEETLP